MIDCIGSLLRLSISCFAILSLAQGLLHFACCTDKVRGLTHWSTRLALRAITNRRSMDEGKELLNFKVHLFRPDTHVWEIRRFYVKERIAMDYILLCKKLQTIFPTLQKKTSSLNRQMMTKMS